MSGDSTSGTTTRHLGAQTGFLFMLSQLLFYFVQARVHGSHETFVFISRYEVFSLLDTDAELNSRGLPFRAKSTITSVAERRSLNRRSFSTLAVILS